MKQPNEHHSFLQRLEQVGLSELLEHAPDPTVIVDARGLIVFSSHQLMAVLGYNRDELLNQPVHVLIPSRFHGAHVTHIRAFFERPAARPMGPGLDLWAVRKDGVEIPVEISLSSVGDGDQRLVVANLRDVSARRQVLLEVQKLNQELSHKTSELEALVGDLRMFAQTASHDLQAPLRQISQFLMLLERRHQDQLSDEAREYVRFAVDGASRLSLMVQDILAYSRIGASEQNFVCVSMAEVLDSVQANLQTLLSESGAELTHDDLPQVRADRAQVEQLLLNLVINAISYRGDDPPRIHLSAELDGEHWRFSVRDNGVGIDGAEHERIFAMFHRAGPSAGRPGSGIGLSICRRVVERHHGRIWVESERGAGATFHFTLPTLEQADRGPTEERADEAA